MSGGRIVRFPEWIGVTSSSSVLAPTGSRLLAERRRRMEMVFGGSDADLFMITAAMACGPELAPAECFDDQVRARLLSA